MKSFKNERQARIFFRRKWLHPKMASQKTGQVPPSQRQFLTPRGIVELPVEAIDVENESVSINDLPSDSDTSCFDFSRRNSNTDEAYRLKIELSDEDELIEISLQSQGSQDATDRDQDFGHDLNESDLGTWFGTYFFVTLN